MFDNSCASNVASHLNNRLMNLTVYEALCYYYYNGGKSVGSGNWSRGRDPMKLCQKFQKIFKKIEPGIKKNKGMEKRRERERSSHQVLSSFASRICFILFDIRVDYFICLSVSLVLCFALKLDFISFISFY